MRGVRGGQRQSWEPAIAWLAIEASGWGAVNVGALESLTDVKKWSFSDGVLRISCSRADCQMLLMLSYLNACPCVANALFYGNAIWVQLASPSMKPEVLLDEVSSADLRLAAHGIDKSVLTALLSRCSTTGPLRLDWIPTLATLQRKVTKRLQLVIKPTGVATLRLNLNEHTWSVLEYLALWSICAATKVVEDRRYVSHNVYYSHPVLTVLLNATSEEAGAYIRSEIASGLGCNTWGRARYRWHEQALLHMPSSIRDCSTLKCSNRTDAWSSCTYRRQHTSVSDCILYTEQPIRLLVALQSKLTNSWLLRIEWDTFHDRYAFYVKAPPGERLIIPPLAHEPTNRRAAMCAVAFETFCSADLRLVDYLPPIETDEFDHFDTLQSWLSWASLPPLSTEKNLVSTGEPAWMDLVMELQHAGLRCKSPPSGAWDSFQENPFADRSLLKHVYWLAYWQALGQQPADLGWPDLAAKQPKPTSMHLLQAFQTAVKAQPDEDAAALLILNDAQATHTVTTLKCSCTAESNKLRISTPTPVSALAALLCFPSAKTKLLNACRSGDGLFDLVVRNISKDCYEAWLPGGYDVTHDCAKQALDALLRVHGLNGNFGDQNSWLPDLQDLVQLEESRVDPRKFMEACAGAKECWIRGSRRLTLNMTRLPFWHSLLFHYLIADRLPFIFHVDNYKWSFSQDGARLRVDGRGPTEVAPEKLMKADEWISNLRSLDRGWYMLLLEAFATLVPALPADPIATSVVGGRPLQTGFMYAMTANAQPQAVTVASKYPIALLSLLMMIKDQVRMGPIHFDYGHGHSWIRFEIDLADGQTATQLEAEIEQAIDSELDKLYLERSLSQLHVMQSVIDLFFRLLCDKNVVD